MSTALLQVPPDFGAEVVALPSAPLNITKVMTLGAKLAGSSYQNLLAKALR
jgi:hypothetical protein